MTPEAIVVHSVDEFIADVRARAERERACVWLEVDGQHFTAHWWPEGATGFCVCDQIDRPQA
jgi:hypothetical protein